MEKKEIVWTQPAKKDLQNIYDYLSEISETIALHIIYSILHRTSALESGYTKIGQEETLLKFKKKGLRYLVEGNYKIIYNETSDHIVIHSIFDTRQNPKKLKKV